MENENYPAKKLITAPDSFTGLMAVVLKVFQQNNALIATGIPDPATIATLNIPAEKKQNRSKSIWKDGKHFL